MSIMAYTFVLLLLCLNIWTFTQGRSINFAKSMAKTGARRLLNTDDDCTFLSTVYLYGTVYTVNVGSDWANEAAEAIVIKDDKIEFVGSNEDAESYIDPYCSEVYDLQGNIVLPGFHDIHMHPLEAMNPVGQVCLLPSLTRPDDQEFDTELSACPWFDRDTEWVLGGGHSITQMMEYVQEGNSPRKLLDDYIPDSPAVMLEETSHSAWANSLALEYAGIDSTTQDRKGGIIMREPGTNIPNGILFENEAISIMDVAMDPKKDSAIYKSNYEGVTKALDKLSTYGITSFCDARLLWRIQNELAWEKACSLNALTARAILGLWAYPEEPDDVQIKKLKQLYSDSNDNCPLRKSQIKIYMDGIVESTTAAMKEKYLKNLSLPVISKENVGLNYFDKARLEKYLHELQELDNGGGFDFHIHAIGDRGIREALDAIKDAKSSLNERQPRHRLTHLEIIDPSDIGKFSELGVIADFQVAGEFTLPSEHATLAEFIGNEKANFSIPVKSVHDTGAVTTFSSDWDVSDLNPFVGLQHAAQRGEQSVSIKTAIEMYTANPAYAMRQEDKVGMLLKGMDADLVIIDKDILNIPVNQIGSTKVIETIFMGERIYKSKDSDVTDITSSFAEGQGPSDAGYVYDRDILEELRNVLLQLAEDNDTWAEKKTKTRNKAADTRLGQNRLSLLQQQQRRGNPLFKGAAAKRFNFRTRFH